MLISLQAFILWWQGLLSPLCCSLPGLPVLPRSLLFLLWSPPKCHLRVLIFSCCSSEDPAPGQRGIGLVTLRLKLGDVLIMIEILYLLPKAIFISTRHFQYKSVPFLPVSVTYCCHVCSSFLYSWKRLIWFMYRWQRLMLST